MPFLVAGTALCLIVLLVLFHFNKYTLWNGFFALAFAVCTGMLLFVLAADSQNSFIVGLLLALAFPALLLLVFGLYILVVLLLLNARQMRKRERHSLSNSLTLLLALGLIALLVAAAFMAQNPPLWLQCLWSGIWVVLAGYFVHLAIFLASAWLCNLAKPPKKQQYIIVLGAGLVNGEVSPLLAARVDRAIKFHQKQIKRKRKGKLLFSGGQGSDEPLSEAQAMQAYAVSRGVPQSDILLEEWSTNTKENMRFSKALIQQDAPGPCRCIFVTSNYHLLRAGKLARAEGMNISALGAKTAWYYLPNALLREYLGYLWMRRVRYALVALLLFVAGALLPLVPYVSF